MGTHLRVLNKSFLMNTNMTGFIWLSGIFMLWTKVALALEGLKWTLNPVTSQVNMWTTTYGDILAMKQCFEKYVLFLVS